MKWGLWMEDLEKEGKMGEFMIGEWIHRWGILLEIISLME